MPDTPDRRTVALGAEQETLLIPLYGRALETRKTEPLVSDPRAVAMVDAIDYDFDSLGTGPSMLGSVLRGMVLDSWVTVFLGAHPGGTVVEIGAGLNTRFERLDNGRARWIEFDLPDVLELRRRFFADTDRRTMLAASVTDDAWVLAATGSPGPWLFVAEAVLLYLPPEQAAVAVDRIRSRFPGSELLMDAFTSAGVAALAEHDTLSRMDAGPRWAWDDPDAGPAAWGPGITVRETCRVTDPPEPVRERLPHGTREVLAAADRGPNADHYQLHRVHVA